jgi:hypothetical protein
VRAQLVLRQILLECGCLVMGKPEVWVQFAGRCFDERGKLTDEPIRDQLALFMHELGRWTQTTGALA